MARSNIRLAAGVGVVAAFLLVGGPGAAAAIADSGGSHSGRSDKGNGSDYRGGGDGNGGSKRGDDDGRNGGDDKKGDWDSDNGQRPRSTVGSGRTGTQGSLTSDGPVAETPADRPGSDHPGASTAEPVRPPRVTFGNGRSPIVQRAEPPRVSDTIEVAPAPPPPVVDTGPAPSPVDIRPPRIVPQFDVAPSAAQTDPLFGLAGLLLIPAAGAFLGYRQARATQAAEVLRRP